MIVKLKGKVESFSEDFIDIDCQGVVFRIFVTENLTKKINKIGEFTSLHIFEIIKEDARLLFGFEENEEQITSTAKHIKQAGAGLLRGGAYKPRTSPYSFQGLECR
mgnify:CR=1 FL=1